MSDPNEENCVIEDLHWILETADVRVQILTLGSGQEVPWHFHTAITDTLVCLDGPMVVKTRDVPEGIELQAGETCTLLPKTPHQAAGKDGGPCRFLVVQGVGKYDFVSIDALS